MVHMEDASRSPRGFDTGATGRCAVRPIDLLIARCHRPNALSTLALRATAEGGCEVDKALGRWQPAIKRSMGRTAHLAVPPVSNPRGDLEASSM
jgi:hypothetical protein